MFHSQQMNFIFIDPSVSCESWKCSYSVTSATPTIKSNSASVEVFKRLNTLCYYSSYHVINEAKPHSISSFPMGISTTHPQPIFFSNINIAALRRRDREIAQTGIPAKVKLQNQRTSIHRIRISNNQVLQIKHKNELEKEH
jgi:hypothetical protein